MDNQDDREIAQQSNNEDLQFRMGLNDNKAGMEGLDKDKINKIIMDVTKGSRFYDNELKKDQQVNQRIEKMFQHKSLLTSSQIKKAQIQVDRLALELERSRDLTRVIVHVDMDAFYAAVEMRDNPELKDKPMAVGSMSMLSTSNYLARRFGVRAAMPGFIAKKLCPNLIIVPLNFDKYRAVSKEVREIFADYDHNFLPLSLDEAYLDITAHLEERLTWPEERRRFIRNDNANKVDLPPVADPTSVPPEAEKVHCTSPVLFEDSESFLLDKEPALSGQNTEHSNDSWTAENVVVFGITAEEAVKEMRFRIERKTTLTASAGIAPNMMLAKVCSDKNKPNGQYVIPHDRQAVMDFIKDLPIRKVPGIGKVTEKMLRALGIVTCTDLYQQRALLSLLFSEIAWHNFLNISLGLGSTHIEKWREKKHEHRAGRTITLKLKNVKFEVKTRASTVSYALSTEEEIFSVAKEILKAEIDLSSPEPLRLRLMGVRASGFLSEDNKRHQKSITSFLCSNKPTANKLCLSAMPDKGAQTSQDPAPPRESFFNQKRAARQLELLESSKTLEISSRDQNATTSHQGTNAERNATISHEVTNEKNASTREVINTEQNTTHVSCQEQEEDNNFQEPDLTCPICMTKQSGWDLVAFNKHIDMCLSKSPHCDDAESTNRCKNLLVGTSEVFFENVGNDDHANNHKNKMVSEAQYDDLDDFVIDKNTAFILKKQDTNVDYNSEITLENIGKESNAGFKDPDNCGPPQSSPSESTLICPVCSLQQHTTDLAAFNRHVDVCLNKGILEELKGDTPNLDQKHINQNVQPSGSTRRGSSSSKSTLRTKRPGATQQNPASKKSKTSRTSNTIERFFK